MGSTTFGKKNQSLINMNNGNLSANNSKMSYQKQNSSQVL
jgi:hypothetical protein